MFLWFTAPLRAGDAYMLRFFAKNTTNRLLIKRTLTSDRGFSALELMVALVISGMMLAATLPAFRTSFVEHRLKSAANQVQSAMRLTRAKAIAEDVGYLIAMYPSTNSYFLVQDTDGDGSPNWGTEPSEGPIDLPTGILLRNNLSQSFASDTIGFNANGTATSGGILAVENDRGEKMYIQLIQSSGICEVLTQEEYDDL